MSVILIGVLIGVGVVLVMLMIAYAVVKYISENKCTNCGKIGSWRKLDSKKIGQEVITKEHRFMQSRSVMTREWIHITYDIYDEVYECKNCKNNMEKKRRKVVKKVKTY